MKNKRYPLLVLIHGWGFDSDVFNDLVSILEQSFRIQKINLPGYAGELDVSEYSLKNIGDIVIDQISEPALYVGWSMGGLIVMDLAARYPEKIKEIVLITSTPCFRKKQNWFDAIDKNILENFVSSYNKQPDETLDKFSYLASEGSENPKNWIRELKKLSTKKVSQQALEQGLQILLTSDLRTVLIDLKISTLMIFGEKDSLVPVSVKEQIKLLNQEITTEVIAGSGHTPFLTDTKLVASLINEHVTR